MKMLPPAWRGLTVQLLAITVLPLTALLLLIAFGSVSLHQRDMRALVGERDERAVRAAAAALASKLHHRAANISNLVTLAESAEEGNAIHTTSDLAADFEGGVAYLDPEGRLMTSMPTSSLWNWITQNISLAASSGQQPVFSSPFLDPNSGQYFVVVSQAIPTRHMIVAGAFSPQTLAKETLATSYPENTQVTVFLLDPAHQILFSSGPAVEESIAPGHPGVSEALRGESGTTYTKQGTQEHVVAYSSILPMGWALITEEEWE